MQALSDQKEELEEQVTALTEQEKSATAEVKALRMSLAALEEKSKEEICRKNQAVQDLRAQLEKSLELQQVTTVSRACLY